jgi:FAD/FMN-containing dehydrogenase/ferredoxin
MSWNDFLIKRAHKTADRRRQTYGIIPPSDVEDLLAQEDKALDLKASFRLLSYILFKSPHRRLKLLWHNLTDQDTPSRKRKIDLMAKALKPRLSKECRLTVHFFSRRNYSQDLARVPWIIEKILFRTTPSLVVQPKTERDVVETLIFAKSRKLPVIPRGTGSFAFGGAVPTCGGVVLDLSPMMEVLEIDLEKKTIRVEPGVRWSDVASELEPYGLAPLTTPTSRFSTVAGWISTGGMGLHSYAYGSVYESVLKIRIARPDGTIEEIDSRNKSLKEVFGTEGQFGILTEITLRVREKSPYSAAHLLFFKSPEKAFDFMETLEQSDLNPSHAVFFDSAYMKKENILFSDHTKLNDPIVTEQDSVLLHFETQENEQKFLSTLNGNSRLASDNRTAAFYLWADRYFPLKAQRISPGLLGAEVVIPQNEINKYISRVRKLGGVFELKPAIEVIICREGRSFSNLVIISFNCDYSRTIHYALSLLFIQLLVRLAVRSGGYPYGIGIWNTPFVKNKYDPNSFKSLRDKKHKIDPFQTLNPHKFFTVKSRFFNIPALFMKPAVFRSILALLHFASPVLGLIAKSTRPEPAAHWNIPDKKDKHGRSLLLQSAQRCTFCGSCISVCPAYHITKNELVTGRTKLRMAEAMLNGGDVIHSEAHASFQCLHCGLCEEVCQTRLPLRDCYLVLEDWIEKRFKSPEETVNNFIEKLDSQRDFIKKVFGLDLPEWSPDEKLQRVPHVEKPSKEGKA